MVSYSVRSAVYSVPWSKWWLIPTACSLFRPKPLIWCMSPPREAKTKNIPHWHWYSALVGQNNKTWIHRVHADISSRLIPTNSTDNASQYPRYIRTESTSGSLMNSENPGSGIEEQTSEVVFMCTSPAFPVLIVLPCSPGVYVRWRWVGRAVFTNLYLLPQAHLPLIKNDDYDGEMSDWVESLKNRICLSWLDVSSLEIHIRRALPVPSDW